MRGTLRARLAGLLHSLGVLLSLMLFRRDATPPPALRGNMRRAVAVPVKDPRFSEAVFILREEAFRDGGVSRGELLEQAKAAAEEETEAMLPQAKRQLRPGLVFLLGAGTALLILYLLKMF